MNLFKNPKIKKFYNDAQESMINYLDSTTSYDKNDVKKCMKIIDFYLIEIEKVISKKEGLSVIKTTVNMLNLLNEDCYHELIETDQREYLAQLINLAATEKGINEKNEDLTEKWRVW
ncbi:hypothetical protein [Aureispira anguillae]|uniref:Uncharacterized protein n=1 Tax=Aureispira anguillae TaxID=2864201 RepID=A0A915YE53_9BACT|nr:hypothetical protein [Aureispira anguillae]BDS11444.1 hypothetical protein AsAng_0021580 [Aureispira anguillae]